MINNNKTLFIKFSTFFANKNLCSSISFDIVEFFNANTCKKILYKNFSSNIKNELK